MKGAIRTETILGKTFDIRKEGASLALECQSIFTTLVRDNNISLDDEINADKGLDMLSSMTRDIVHRIKYVFVECVEAPKITVESFEELPPTIIPQLFLRIYEYQTKEAEDKKKEPNNSTD